MQLPAEVHDSVPTPALSPALAGIKFVGAFQTPAAAAPEIGAETRLMMPNNSKLTEAKSDVTRFTLHILFVELNYRNL
jgi:hypothetical protein